MPLHIGQKTEQLDLLDKEIAKRQDTIRQLIEEYNIPTEDLKEYRSSRPLILESSLNHHILIIKHLIITDGGE